LSSEYSLGLEGFTGQGTGQPDLEIQLTDPGTGKSNRITHWTEYRVVQDIFSPADGFDCTMAAIENQRQFTSTGGQRAKVFSYGALQVNAIVDERSEATNLDNTDLQITGRGVGGLLLDSAVPPDRLSLANLTLSKAVQRITEPWQPTFITGVSTNAAGSRYLISGGVTGGTARRSKRVLVRDSAGNAVRSGPNSTPLYRVVPIPAKKGKANRKAFGKNSPVYAGTDQDSLRQTRIQPGEKVWDVISRLSRQIGAHAWVGAEGNVIIARPQYDFDAKAYGEGIVLKWDKTQGRATGGNVMGVQFETSISERHSETVAWGTGKPKKNSAGKKVLQKTIKVIDPSPAFWATNDAGGLGANKLYKPNLITVKNVQDRKLIKRLIRGNLEESIINSFSLEYEMPGHFAPSGVLWAIDSMVNIQDDRNGFQDSFYITKVERRFSMDRGKSTVLKVIPAKIWLYLDQDATGDDAYLNHLLKYVWW
jgi:prophage tail gpP-like protein